MFKRLSLVLVLVLLVGACGSDRKSSSSPTQGPSQSSGNAASGDPIVVGIVTDQTSPAAAIHSKVVELVKSLAVKFNSEGGVLGRPLKLVIENDEGDATKTSAIVQKVASEGAKVLILQTGGANILQAKPTLEKLKIPAIAPTSSSIGVTTPPDNSYVFSQLPPSFAPVLCSAFKAAGFKKMGVISDDTPIIAAQRDGYLKAMNGCVDTAVELAPVSSSDLTAPVSRLASDGVDVVMVNTINAPFEALAHNTIKELLAGKQQFSTGLAFQTGTDKLADPGALEGVVAIANLDPQKPGAQMVADFLKSTKGPDYQFTLTDLMAWDAMQILKAVIEKAGTDDPQKITDAFQTLSGYQPTWGQRSETLSYSSTKHVGADGLCGFVLLEYGPDNKPLKPWATFQPAC